MGWPGAWWRFRRSPSPSDKKTGLSRCWSRRSLAFGLRVRDVCFRVVVVDSPFDSHDVVVFGGVMLVVGMLLLLLIVMVLLLVVVGWR